MRQIIRIGLTLTVLVVAGLAGGYLFLQSGMYDIAANKPHFAITRTVLGILKRNSVQVRSRALEVPDLSRPELIKRGLPLYEQYCVACHGAPGIAPERMGLGLNPTPPPLVMVNKTWGPEDIAWITANGIKMAGMPAFSLGEDRQDLWAITAFVLRMSRLDPEQYQAMKNAIQTNTSAAVNWAMPEEGWDVLRQRGNAARGRASIKRHGCPSCHAISGFGETSASAAPPLRHWGERHYLAGKIINYPYNLVSWLQAPHKVKRDTAMPDVGLDEEEAWNIARFLYDES